MHYLALVTICATFPLLTLGAEVTTKKAGMADEVGFRAPWHLLTVWLEGNPRVQEVNYVVEHSHRIVGFVVGICAIALALAMWFDRSRNRVRWLGLAALLAVIFQGVLGIIRVNYNLQLGPATALIHGCTAQLVFLVLLSTAVVTSRTWEQVGESAAGQSCRKNSVLSVLMLTAIYGQMILGAFVRHGDSVIAFKWHILFAFVIVSLGVWLLVNWLSQSSITRAERIVGIVLAVVLLLQIYLGLESALSKYIVSNPWTGREFGAIGSNGYAGSLTRSLHYVTGTLLFGTTFIIGMFALRRRYISLKQQQSVESAPGVNS